MPRKARPGAAYGTRKAFVIWYTEQMAAAFGAKGARIVSVSPGTFVPSARRWVVAAGADGLVPHAAHRPAGRPEGSAAGAARAALRGPRRHRGGDVRRR